MCGICGILSKEGIEQVHLDSVHKMNTKLVHRGPDGSGFFSDEYIALAMRRLSIIDLQGGWQPLYNEDRNLVLIVNGEIYNFIELRFNLERKGHHFTTKSDCETILHLYEEYGVNFVQYLRGMYAFALWDIKYHRLILGRDRMGEKPLYLYEKENFLLFASELKAILSSGMVPFELDPNSINLFFHYQYVPEPRTPIKNVRKLPAGHILIIDLFSWKFSETCYWQMETVPPVTGNPGELIKQTLEEISEIIIRSDVPVGIALSGGLDSSAIAALIIKNYPETMHAFSVGYHGRPECDERSDAEVLADCLGMPFHDIELKTDDFVSNFPDIVYFCDDPIADISGYGYYSVMKLARKHNVPVILQGHGGDELFWGYPWVKNAVWKSLRKQKFLKKESFFWKDYFIPALPTFYSPKKIFLWLRDFSGFHQVIEEYKRDKKSPIDQMVFIDEIPDFHSVEKFKGDFYSIEFNNKISKNEPYSIFTLPLPWKHVDIMITKLICHTYLLENGITQGDRLSMVSSVELRLPLVDYKLVETIIGLRKNYPDYSLPPKTWFKAALKGLVPDSIINRPKRGFSPPVKEWHIALFQKYGEFLKDGYLVSNSIIKANTGKFLSKGVYSFEESTSLSFKALVLELWCRKMNEIVVNSRVESNY